VISAQVPSVKYANGRVEEVAVLWALALLAGDAADGAGGSAVVAGLRQCQPGGQGHGTELSHDHRDHESGRGWDLVEGRKEEQARELLQEIDTTRRARVRAAT
jgi:hypothetical protein